MFALFWGIAIPDTLFILYIVIFSFAFPLCIYIYIIYNYNYYISAWFYMYLPDNVASRTNHIAIYISAWFYMYLPDNVASRRISFVEPVANLQAKLILLLLQRPITNSMVTLSGNCDLVNSRCFSAGGSDVELILYKHYTAQPTTILVRSRAHHIYSSRRLCTHDVSKVIQKNNHGDP